VTPTPTPGITLSACGYSIGSADSGPLLERGEFSPNIDIYRNGVVVATTGNDGFYTDSPGGRGPATYTYQVCNEGTQTCSNQVTVTF